jgi:2-polyprenyl-3-methyl-5-hydroxy-6-metoxy-1,4-benzoquinol methylase
MNPAPPMSKTRPNLRACWHHRRVPAAPAEPVAGNVYNKYATPNPVVRRLVTRFLSELDELIDLIAPAELLDIGCGEGVVTEHMAARLPSGAQVLGLDRELPKFRTAWAHRSVELITGDAHALPFDDDAFDVVTAIEMLQAVTDPAQVLAEAARVARRAVIATVPDEPLWRALNVARGAYLREAGNTPGHMHHWSRRSFADLLAPHGRLVSLRRCRPWLLAVVRVT